MRKPRNNNPIRMVINAYDYRVHYVFPNELSKAIALSSRFINTEELKCLAKKLLHAEPKTVGRVSEIVRSNEVINHAIRSYLSHRVPISYFDHLLKTLEICAGVGIIADSGLLKKLAVRLIRIASLKTKVVRYSSIGGKTEADSDEDEFYFELAARSIKLCREVGIIDKFVRSYALHGNLGTSIRVYSGTGPRDVGGYDYKPHYKLVIGIARLGASAEAVKCLIEKFSKIRNTTAINELKQVYDG